jgi:hypothetical protein
MRMFLNPPARQFCTEISEAAIVAARSRAGLRRDLTSGGNIMALDKLALILVAAGAAVWCLVMLTGLVASLPFGLPLLIIFLIGGYIVYRVIQDRLSNEEDDYYDKNIKQ